MRRLHFHENATPIKDPPAPNPNGDPPPYNDPRNPLPPTPRSEFKDLVDKAKHEWLVAVKKLNALINGDDPDFDQNFYPTTADMVEVNGYIVSMRIVSTERSRMLQIGGSSSSHIYISAAFSSSASARTRRRPKPKKRAPKKPAPKPKVKK
jgi:hypothetical protein